ncbi:MAG: hypothetical protein PHQ40_19365 [Anaerolineaceae bacterium]|nr:hypothetical protein [Anaerolineaceae bacterium]
MILSLGGIKVEFNFNLPEWVLPAALFHRDFFITGSPEVCITVYPTDYPEDQLGDPVFVSTSWSTYHVGRQTAIRLFVTDQWHTNGTYTLILNPDGDCGELYISVGLGQRNENGSIELLPPGLDHLLAVWLLSRHCGVMLHSCGLQTSTGRGLIFTGISGAGKSTTAILWKRYAGATLFCDERVAVRKQDGCFWLHGTPWHGKDTVAKPGPASLERLFVLQHASENIARPLRPAEAISLLLPRAYLPFWDRDGMANTLEFLEDLSSTIPCYELGFTPDQRAVDYVQCLISS